ncbi:isoaspartyl peptidase/L-asparaginase family protein [Luteithermobacter gelatinilyticus]|uniref:isoaspartyl peptidase/L-asparaginase family protein n=1 Tax=Luteithermobacter gelatinilyticus TaxID=2582913 RepID=UPI001105B8FF|nr:isoaspartyl peptidase/L-asparaginase [Luteithermobacter gelatinilyticus]
MNFSRIARISVKLILWGAMMTGLAQVAAQADDTRTTGEYRLVIHGGAGTIMKENMTPELEAAYRAKLKQALRAGQAVLARGGAALDAVTAAITVMEDSPLFNAGKGAVFTHEGRNEMDASLMEGRDLNAGAVAGVRRVKNPILLARKVMEHSPHVMLAGEGAEEFAELHGMELVDPGYFRTEHRWRQLQKALQKDRIELDHSDEETGDQSRNQNGVAPLEGVEPGDPDYKFGTVGAVALDRHGNLAAGTSTGGMTNKRWNRIGDSPVIGAGTYADNMSCAVSATGHGEFFIRATVARSICALMEYKGLSLEQAAEEIIHNKLVKMGGDGGIIAVDRAGNISMTFNTSGMYRGYVSGDGAPVVGIYKD